MGDNRYKYLHKSTINLPLYSGYYQDMYKAVRSEVSGYHELSAYNQHSLPIKTNSMIFVYIATLKTYVQTDVFLPCTSHLKKTCIVGWTAWRVQRNSWLCDEYGEFFV